MAVVETLINDVSQVPPEPGFSDLDIMYHTGKGIRPLGARRDTGYRNGVQTQLGDIEYSVWKKVAMALIDRSGELDIYQALVQWATEHAPWLHTQRKIEEYALELHIGRIFENEEWADFRLFREKYWPRKATGMV